MLEAPPILYECSLGLHRVCRDSSVQLQTLRAMLHPMVADSHDVTVQPGLDVCQLPSPLLGHAAVL